MAASPQMRTSALQPEDAMDHAETPRAPLVASGAPRYDGLSMALHWLTLGLLIVLFGAIWARERASDGDATLALLTIHRSAGALVWAVTLARLAWKVRGGRTPALPSSTPRMQRWAARANEYALYLLLAVQPVTGFVQSVARGKPFPLLGLSVPAVMARDKDLSHLFHAVHEASATVLLILVGLHACAALFHGLVLRDGVLGTMLPAGRRPLRK